jgi:hypothetical protein
LAIGLHIVDMSVVLMSLIIFIIPH